MLTSLLTNIAITNNLPLPPFIAQVFRQASDSSQTFTALQNKQETNVRQESGVKDYEYIEKQVDRSYNRFFNQFSFALGLIGIAVWIFRQSVIDQLKKEIRQQLEIAKLVEEDNKLKARLRKNEILLQLSSSLPPEEVFFQSRTTPEIQKILESIIAELDKEKDKIKAERISERIDRYLDLTFIDYIILGDAYFCLKDYEKASSAYEKAETAYREVIEKRFPEINPKSHSKALFGSANALRKQGQKLQKSGDKNAHKLFQQSIKAYDKAIKADKYYFAAYVNKGLATRWLKDSNGDGLLEAIEYFKKAIKIEPNYYRAWYNMACYYSLLSDSSDVGDSNQEKALRYLEKAVEIAPSRCVDLAMEDSDLNNIRNTERFSNLVSKVESGDLLIAELSR